VENLSGNFDVSYVTGCFQSVRQNVTPPPCSAFMELFVVDVLRELDSLADTAPVSGSHHPPNERVAVQYAPQDASAAFVGLFHVEGIVHDLP
jgi:hypothetical protein